MIEENSLRDQERVRKSVIEQERGGEKEEELKWEKERFRRGENMREFERVRDSRGEL